MAGWKHLIAPQKKEEEKYGDMGEDRLPCFYLNSKQLPDIKDWETGKKYVFEVKMIEKSERETEEEMGGYSGAFRVLAAKTSTEEADEESKED